MRFVFRVLAVCLCVLLIGGLASAETKKLKAGFVYVGPVGDLGWSHAHDVGRKFAHSKLPWLESIFIESVPEADSARIIDRFIQEEKCDVVFTTSFGYMDDTIKAGMKYPDKHFMHCSGFKQSKNVGTYFADTSSLGLFLDVGGQDNYWDNLTNDTQWLDPADSPNWQDRNFSVGVDRPAGTVDFTPIPTRPPSLNPRGQP